MKQGLLKEIQKCLPQRGDISEGGHNTSDPKAFTSTAQRIFPVGRIFAGHKQLDWKAIMFGSHWAFQLMHSGTVIGCHYGCSEQKQDWLHVDETKLRRKWYYSPNDRIKCPFVIRYSRVDYSSVKSNQLPKVYYRSKITLTNFTHTCDLNTCSDR